MGQKLQYFTVFRGAFWEKFESFTINVDKVLFIFILGSAVNSMIDAINAAVQANPSLDYAVLQPLEDIVNYLYDILNLLNNANRRVKRNTGKRVSNNS